MIHTTAVARYTPCNGYYRFLTVCTPYNAASWCGFRKVGNYISDISDWFTVVYIVTSSLID